MGKTGLELIPRPLPGAELRSVNPLQKNLTIKNIQIQRMVASQVERISCLFWKFYCGNVVTNLFLVI